MTSTPDPIPVTPPTVSSGPSRLIIPVLAITGLLGAMNQMSLGAFLPVISRDLSVSVPLLGQITTAIFLGSAGIGLLAGPLADQFGKRRLLVIGLGVVAVSCVGTMLAPSYGWLLAARMLSAISGGILVGTAFATAGTLFTDDTRLRAMGWIAGGVASSAIVGIPILTLIASVTSWRGAYGAVSVLAMLGILLIRRLLPDDTISDSGRIEIGNILAAYRPLIHQRSMLALYSATLVRAIGWTGTLAYIGAYLGQELGLSTREIGWAYMAGGGGFFLGTKLAGSRLGGLGPRELFAISTVTSGIMLGLSIALPVGPAASIAILTGGGIGGGVGQVLLVTLVSTETPAGQGTTMSLNQAMFALGSALGGLFGGMLLALGGYTTLALGLMGFMTMAAVIVWRPAMSRTPSESPVASAD